MKLYEKESDSLLITAIRAAIQGGYSIMKIYESDDFDVSLKSDNSPLTRADRDAHNSIISILESIGLPVLSEEGKEIGFEKRALWDEFWLVDPLDGTKEFIKRNDEFTVNIALISGNTPVMGVVYVPVTGYLYFSSIKIGAYLFKSSLINEDEDLNLNSLMADATKLPATDRREVYTIVGSRSHMSSETEDFIKSLSSKHGEIKMISKGSSLKLCMVAEGKADIYPRFGPTMEWDTAAGHAIVLGSGRKVTLTDMKTNLTYNKESLLNPWFIVH